MSAMSRQDRSTGFITRFRGSYEAARRTDDPRGSRAEDLLELERRGLLELVVPAVGRLLVEAPALEGRRVADPVALEMVVGNLCDALESQRLPRQVLASVPA